MHMASIWTHCQGKVNFKGHMEPLHYNGAIRSLLATWERSQLSQNSAVHTWQVAWPRLWDATQGQSLLI